jgi:hypothetical protein
MKSSFVDCTAREGTFPAVWRCSEFSGSSSTLFLCLLLLAVMTNAADTLAGIGMEVLDCDINIGADGVNLSMSYRGLFAFRPSSDLNEGKVRLFKSTIVI